MAKEIERKYIVTGTGWKSETLLKKQSITQGYISKELKHTVRVRVTSDNAYLTIKGPKKGITRSEYEYEIPKADGEELIKMCDKPLVTKVRHYVQDSKNQMWMVDVFAGKNRGLTIAEIELENAKQYVAIPEWIGREVTHDKRYTNTYLADHKAPRK